MKKLKSILFAMGFTGLALLLAGCSHMVILHPHGQVAMDEKQLLTIAVLLMLIVIIPVFILTFIFIRRYRHTNKRAAYKPEWAHSNILEFVWWSIPIIIIIVLSVISWVTTHQLDPYRTLDVPGKPLRVDAIALRWKWLFVYPEEGIATVNTLHIPKNRQISFYVTADAPMNALQIPAFGGQIYAMNGMRTKLHIVANKTGKFVGFSTSFSGAGFSGMRFPVYVTSAAQFDAWVQHTKQSPLRLTMSAYHNLAKPSERNKPAYYSYVEKDLFQKVIEMFMSPEMHKVHKQKQAVQL